MLKVKCTSGKKHFMILNQISVHVFGMVYLVFSRIYLALIGCIRNSGQCIFLLEISPSRMDSMM